MQPEPIVTRSWINSSLVMLARQAGEKRQCGWGLRAAEPDSRDVDEQSRQLRAR
jgi:hypothetical protein